MKNKILKGIIWKAPFVAIAIWVLHVEVSAYSDTKGSIGELFLYPNQENAFTISLTMTIILGLVLIFSKSKIYMIVAVCLICFILLLFYPSWDMQGVEQAF